MTTISITDAISNTDNTTKVTFNFYTCKIISDSNNVAMNIQKVTDSSTSKNYIQINKYPYNGNAFHIQHNINGTTTNYIVNEIRIFTAVHQINGSSYSGEMIIETASIDQDDDYLTYFCIPLKGGASNDTDLDSLIRYTGSSTNGKVPSSLLLNNLIPTQKSAYYYTSNATASLFGNGSGTVSATYVVVLGTPISITTKTATHITNHLTYSPNANITTASSSSTTSSSSSSGNVYNKISQVYGASTLSSDNIYIDCNDQKLSAEEGGDETTADDTKADDKSYKLTAKDIKDIFYTVGTFLFIVFFVFIANTYCISLFSNDKDEFEKSGLTKMFEWIHNYIVISHYAFKDKDGKVKYRLYYSTVILVMLFLTCIILFFYSISKKNLATLKSFIIIFIFTCSLISIMNMNMSISPTDPTDPEKGKAENQDKAKNQKP